MSLELLTEITTSSSPVLFLAYLRANIRGYSKAKQYMNYVNDSYMIRPCKKREKISEFSDKNPYFGTIGYLGVNLALRKYQK